jgi:hypothetical protein
MIRKGYIACLFHEVPTGTLYRAGAWSYVPEKQAAEYIRQGMAERWYFEGETPDEIDLPEDLPGRDALIEAGFKTVAGVLSIDDYDEVPGIGQVTEQKLRDYFNGW